MTEEEKKVHAYIDSVGNRVRLKRIESAVERGAEKYFADPDAYSPNEYILRSVADDFGYDGPDREKQAFDLVSAFVEQTENERKQLQIFLMGATTATPF